MNTGPRLPPVFLEKPIAHRGYHNKSDGMPENSLVAVKAALTAGYCIELDLQLSGDGVAMVFHDARLDRLTESTGPVANKTADELGQIRLRHGTECIPTLATLLKLVAGRVPLLIEMKDQTGVFGPGPDTLEQALVNDLADYTGLVAVMSFNPHSVTAFGALAPKIPRGLVTEDFMVSRPSGVPPETLQSLTQMTQLESAGATFISHDHTSLNTQPVAIARTRGFDVLCWTVRSEKQEAEARKYAQNITFENYAAKFPGA